MHRTTHLPHPLHTPATAVTRSLYGILLGVLCYVALLLVEDVSLTERTRFLRYWSLLSSAVFVVAMPNVLLPDDRVPTAQLLNWPPAHLLRYQLRAWAPVLALFIVPAFLMAFYDVAAPLEALPVKAYHMLLALLVMLGIGMYSFIYYATVGPTSQAWHEGRAGGWYQNIQEETGHGFSVPRGLVPALFGTTWLFTLALGVVLVATYLTATAVAWAWVPGTLLFVWGVGRILHHQATYDRSFYSTNAFYSEVLGATHTTASTDRTPVAYDELYWVPHRWRPLTWSRLLQFDRILPMGRIVALAHLLLWMLFYQGARPSVIQGYLVLMLLAQNGACFLPITQKAAPAAFNVTWHAPVDWWMARTFANLRWLAPLLLSLLAVAAFSASFTWRAALTWAGADVLLAALAAGLATYVTEGTARREYA